VLVDQLEGLQSGPPGCREEAVGFALIDPNDYVESLNELLPTIRVKSEPLHVLFFSVRTC
jgi:hypothetical protein